MIGKHSSQFPMGRMGMAWNVAYAALFFASDDGSMHHRSRSRRRRRTLLGGGGPSLGTRSDTRPIPGALVALSSWGLRTSPFKGAAA